MQTATLPERDIKAFIVDDASDFRRRLSNMLADIEGVCIVGEAGNPVDAITGIHRTRPDAVVLDAHLGDSGSGMDVLHGLRFHEFCIVFIVLTNLSSTPYREAYMAAGAHHFLDKHIEFEKVADILANLKATDR